MKNNEIEQFFEENRDRFDSDFPPEGHLGRFTSKLNKHNTSKDRKRLFFIFKIAAVVVVILAISSVAFWSYFNISYSPIEKLNFSISSNEFDETKSYYSDQINICLQQIESMQFVEKGQKDTINNELSIMDNNCLQLQQELKSNPGDERLMKAIIDLYQVKLEAVNLILQSASISQINIKKENHESNI